MSAKLLIISLSFLPTFGVLAETPVSSRAITYSCNGYGLTIVESKVTLRNVSLNHESELVYAGANSGFSSSVQMSGTIVPLGMNVLARVAVEVKNSMFKGSRLGWITVGSEGDSRSKIRYSCKSETAGQNIPMP